MKKFLLTAMLTLITSGSAAAQGITGEWNASMNTPGGAREFRVLFVQAGEKLTGTVKRPSGDVPLEGSVVGNNVKFAYSINYGGNPLTLTVTTTLAGDAMTGQVDYASQAQEAFSAKRIVSAPPANPPRTDAQR
jgi:opacity protein-like surface antigen